MPSTYSSLHYHLVFGTKARLPTIAAEWRPNLHAYMGGIVSNLGGRPLAIGGVADHVHLLAGLKPIHQLSEFVRSVKSSSSAWVHAETRYREFAWQEGYAVIAVGPSEIGRVTSYVNGQEEHHKKVDFRSEYLAICEEAGIEIDMRYFD